MVAGKVQPRSNTKSKHCKCANEHHLVITVHHDHHTDGTCGQSPAVLVCVARLGLLSHKHHSQSINLCANKIISHQNHTTTHHAQHALPHLTAKHDIGMTDEHRLDPGRRCRTSLRSSGRDDARLHPESHDPWCQCTPQRWLCNRHQRISPVAHTRSSVRVREYEREWRGVDGINIDCRQCM